MKDFGSREYYVNRELSWLMFDERVLGEATDTSNPLMERLKFLSITASNLDEFFMVRVASLIDMQHAGYNKRDIAGMTTDEQLEAIADATHELVDTQYFVLMHSLLPLMEAEGINLITKHEELTADEAAYIDRYFEEEVYPVLTPMAVDSSRPFPLVRNQTLNIGALIGKRGEESRDFATVQVPSVLDRIVEIPSEYTLGGSESGRTFILLEEVIERNMHKLFLNYDVFCAYPYRIMRNADLTIDEEEAADLLKEIEKQIKRRQWGEVIRLEVADDIDPGLMEILKKELSVRQDSIYRIPGPIDLTFLMKMYGIDGFDHLKREKYIPKPVKEINDGADIFEAIRNHDILMHHPYQSFDPVIDFVKSAAKDPDVLAIKQTLYRVSGNSPIIAALEEAAENGKQVTVLVELKARFDEEHNIVWARRLEKAGCHVIYGLVGLKTHCKIMLVVRREEDGIRRYVHLGTGNYNDSTAKLYTDLGLLTCAEQIGEDATAVFNMLSGYSEPLYWNRLSLAPLWLKDRFIHLIEREAANAREGKKSHIIAKVNSICDKEVIQALYNASCAGVRIELIVRGICCLKPGIRDVSENITVRSIVGDFLEHSRIFYFENAGNCEVYCGSSDWMPRNLLRRVEIMFPILDERLKNKVISILATLLADTVKARVELPDGTYERTDKRGRDLLSAQEQFCENAAESVAVKDPVANSRVFIPIEGGNLDV
ncbi:MAG: RNA degradosome polyphosphate kinase [Lachnospiraceae bacterium]|nr:RNA degradosome polyphosphate kinase [Lachnospiraceae bacterium]